MQCFNASLPFASIAFDRAEMRRMNRALDSQLRLIPPSVILKSNEPLPPPKKNPQAMNNDRSLMNKLPKKTHTLWGRTFLI